MKMDTERRMEMEKVEMGRRSEDRREDDLLSAGRDE